MLLYIFVYRNAMHRSTLTKPPTRIMTYYNYNK